MTATASSAVAARSRPSRSRSIPSRAGAPSSARVNTASFPMTTPCSLAPISAPHIHHGRDNSTAWVRVTWGTLIHVQATVVPSGWEVAGTQSRTCASLGSRSLFLANSSPSSVTRTRVSHTGGPPSSAGPLGRAPDHMVVDHAHRLEERVEDGGPHEGEVAPLQVLAHGPAHLQPVADDARVGQQGGDLVLVVADDASRVEPVERGAIILTLGQDGRPRQAGLGPLQDQHLEEVGVVVGRHAPLLVVVGPHGVRRLRPGAAGGGPGTRRGHGGTLSGRSPHTEGPVGRRSPAPIRTTARGRTAAARHRGRAWSAARGWDMDSELLHLAVGTRHVLDLTDDLVRFCRGRGDGLANVFAPHATAGIALMEVGSGSESDLADALERLLPRDDRYRHRHGATGHGADHVLPALVGPSVTIPVLDGTPMLGTWQSVVLVDTNGDNPDRTVRLSFLAG